MELVHIFTKRFCFRLFAKNSVNLSQMDVILWYIGALYMSSMSSLSRNLHCTHTWLLFGGNGAVLFKPQCASSSIFLTLVLLHVSPTSRLPLSDSCLCQAAKPSFVLTVNVHYLAKKVQQRQQKKKDYHIGLTMQTGCGCTIWSGCTIRGNKHNCACAVLIIRTLLSLMFVIII